MVEEMHKMYEVYKKIQNEIKERPSDQNLGKCDTLKTVKDVLIAILNKLKKNDLPENHFRHIGMEACIIYDFAKYADIDDDTKQQFLQEAIDIIGVHAHKPECVFIYLRIINIFSFLLTEHGKTDEPQKILEDAENIYNNMILDNALNIYYYTPEDLFSRDTKMKPSPDTRSKVDKLITNNLQMQAYVYSKKGWCDKFVIYHHAVLRRQLEMTEGDPVSWATKTARLAGFFISRSNFREARHHLTAAYTVLVVYEEDLKSQENTPDVIAKKTFTHLRIIEICRLWVKYSLTLFRMSKTTSVNQFYGGSREAGLAWLEEMWHVPIIPDKYEETCTINSIPNLSEHLAPFNLDPSSHRTKGETSGRAQIHSGLFSAMELRGEGDIKLPQHPQSLLTFPSLKLDIIEKQVTWKAIETIEQARALFLFARAWLVKVKTFYSYRDYAFEYVKCVLYLSELYQHLAFYEHNIDSRYNIQKRRAYTLEALNALLREAHKPVHAPISIEVLKELAKVQLELMALNLKRVCTAGDRVSSSGAENKPGKLSETAGAFTASTQNVTVDKKIEKMPAQANQISNADHLLHKMEAVSHISAKLEQVGDKLEAMKDFEDTNS